MAPDTAAQPAQTRVTLDDHLRAAIPPQVLQAAHAAIRDWLVQFAETLSIPTVDQRASRRDYERAEVLRWLADTNDVAGVGWTSDTAAQRPEKGTPEWDVWVAAIEVAIAAPLNHDQSTVHSAKIPWTRVVELREALDRAGIDWRTAWQRKRQRQ